MILLRLLILSSNLLNPDSCSVGAYQCRFLSIFMKSCDESRMSRDFNRLCVQFLLSWGAGGATLGLILSSKYTLLWPLLRRADLFLTQNTMSLHTLSHRPKECGRSPGAGIIGIYEMPSVGAVNQTQVPQKNSKHSEPLSRLSLPLPFMYSIALMY